MGEDLNDRPIKTILYGNSDLARTSIEPQNVSRAYAALDQSRMATTDPFESHLALASFVDEALNKGWNTEEIEEAVSKMEQERGGSLTISFVAKPEFDESRKNKTTTTLVKKNSDPNLREPMVLRAYKDLDQTWMGSGGLQSGLALASFVDAARTHGFTIPEIIEATTRMEQSHHGQFTISFPKRR